MTNAKEMFEKFGTLNDHIYVRLFDIKDIAAIIQQTVSDYEREVLPGKIAEAKNKVLDEVTFYVSDNFYNSYDRLWAAQQMSNRILAIKSTPPSQTNSWLTQVFIEANASNESKPNPK